MKMCTYIYKEIKWEIKNNYRRHDKTTEKKIPKIHENKR